jgi:hypothetical protein
MRYDPDRTSCILDEELYLGNQASGEAAGSVACRTWHMSVGGTTRLMERVPRTQCTKNCHSLPLICWRPQFGWWAPKEFTGPGALGGLPPSVASVHYHH